MFKSLFSNRLFIGALVFFVLCVVGGSLYMWYDDRRMAAELARHDERIKAFTEKQAPKPVAAVRRDKDTPQQHLPTSEVPVQQTEVSQEPPGGSVPISSEKPEAQVAASLAEIVAEEEKAEEALSAEELEKLKIGKRVREIHREILDILTAAGGKLHSTTHPEEIRQILHLQQEKAALMKQVPNGPDPEKVSKFEYLTQLGLMSNKATNANGEMLASEAFKIADYMESVGFDVQGAIGLRMLADVAIENGDDAIRQEHYELLHQKMAEIDRLFEDEEHR